MSNVKYWDGEDFRVLDSKNAKSVNGIKFRINEDILEYSNDGLTWSSAGQGDMAKAVYDTNDNGMVDNAEKVNGFTIGANVPANAKFTDTITTINGKTGTITKADITALGIPAQDTVVDISGKADKTYVDNKVKTDVPAGAKFTDTVYSHPATHPASMITGLPTKLSELQNDIGAGAGLNRVTSATEPPQLNTGDEWHKEV